MARVAQGSFRMLESQKVRDPGLGSSRYPTCVDIGRTRLGKKGTTMNDLPTALKVLFTETYYWLTVVVMFLIHVGFCTYEVGVARRKNHMTTLMKNTMVIPVVGITFLSVRLVALFGDGQRLAGR